MFNIYLQFRQPIIDPVNPELQRHSPGDTHSPLSSHENAPKQIAETIKYNVN